MRKVFSIFALALLLLSVSACNDDSKDGIVHKFQGEFINNSVDLSTNTSVKVSSSLVDMVWNVTESTISLSFAVNYDGHNTANVAINDAALNADKNLACYTFVAQDGGDGITSIKGYYSPDNGTFLMVFIVNHTHRVFCSAQLVFPYMRCTVTDTGDPTNPYHINDNVGMAITIDPATMKARMVISNLAFTDNSEVMIKQMVFYDLNVEATIDGYKVTTDHDIKCNEGTYTLNELVATVHQYCHKVSGTFKIDGRYVGSFSGNALAQ